MEKIRGSHLLFCGNGNAIEHCPDNRDFLRRLGTISAYNCAYDLLETETVLSVDDDDFLDFLRGFDAFESYAYFCVNSEIVIITDDVTGDVLYFCSLDDFLRTIKKHYEMED